RLQLVGQHEAGVAGIGAAYYGERRRSAALDHTRDQPRHLGSAAHVEIDIAAPELLYAFDGLSGLESSFDHLEVVTLIGSSPFGDLMNHRRQVRVKHAETHGVGPGRTRNAWTCQ